MPLLVLRRIPLQILKCQQQRKISPRQKASGDVVERKQFSCYSLFDFLSRHICNGSPKMKSALGLKYFLDMKEYDVSCSFRFYRSLNQEKKQYHL